MACIVLADDRLDELQVLAMLLEAGGHKVLAAMSPNDAIRQIERGGPDAVLLDLKFPNAQGEPDAEEGFALIRRIHELAPGAAVFVLSGWPEEIYGRPEEGLVTRVMVKPVLLPALLEAISEVCAPGRSLPSASR